MILFNYRTISDFRESLPDENCKYRIGDNSRNAAEITNNNNNYYYTVDLLFSNYVLDDLLLGEIIMNISFSRVIFLNT